MLRSNVKDPDIPKVGDHVYIWRDDSGWVGPARITKVDLYGVEVLHNGHLKTARMNWVKPLDDQDPTSTSLGDQDPMSTSGVKNSPQYRNENDNAMSSYNRVLLYDDTDDEVSVEIGPLVHRFILLSHLERPRLMTIVNMPRISPMMPKMPHK